MKLFTMRAVRLACFLALSGSAFGQLATEDQAFAGGPDPDNTRFANACDLDGDRAIVAARTDSEFGSKSGAVYIFELEGGSWVEKQRLTASDASQGDHFGTDVAIRGDRAIIGAELRNHPVVSGSAVGAAYIFERQPSGTWLEVAKVDPPAPSGGDHHGIAVDIDGNFAVVGAYGTEGTQSWGAGAIYVYERQPDGSWPEAERLQSPQDFAYLGLSVAVRGERIAGGAPEEPTTAGRGAVYIYDRQGDGSWLETQRLVTPSGLDAVHFGQAIALGDDLLVVGDPAERDIINEIPGAAFVFARQAGNTWTHEDTLVPDSPKNGDEFAYSVSLDGERAAIGARFARDGGPNKSGSVWTFVRQGTSWVAEAAWVAEDSLAGREFGSDVSLDSNRLLVGIGQASNQARVAYEFEVGELLHGPLQASVAGAIEQDLLLRPGSDQAGKFFLLLGSITGTSPGIPLPGNPGEVLPLKSDPYFKLTLAGNGPLVNASGFLDANGQADASVSLPFGLDPAFVGLSLNHAYVTYDVGTDSFLLASNAVRLEFLP